MAHDVKGYLEWLEHPGHEVWEIVGTCLSWRKLQIID